MIKLFKRLFRSKATKRKLRKLNNDSVDHLKDLEKKKASLFYQINFNKERSNSFLNDYAENEDARIEVMSIILEDSIESYKSLKIEIEDIKKQLENQEVEEVEEPNEALKAFPSAKGAGCYATGGRGKPNYYVTNLRDNGAGSFRQCLENTKSTNGGNIIFNTSGTIKLTSKIAFSNADNITIYGQSAPVGGIATANFNVIFQNVNNLIMRYVKFRPQLSVNSEIDAFEIFQSNNYIIDHCSFSWGTDEVANSGEGSNYTWQRNLFAESKSTGMIIGGEASLSDNLSFLENVFYNCSHRFPNWQSDGRVDIINNIAWSFRSQISVPSGVFKVNHINNYYRYFTDNPPSTVNKGMMYQPTNSQTKFPSIHTKGNYVNDVLTDPNADNWSIWRWRFNPSGTVYSGAGNESALTRDFKKDDEFAQLGEKLEYQSSVSAFDNIPKDVGANKAMNNSGVLIFEQDAPDNIYTSNIVNETLVSYTQDSNLQTQHYTDYQNAVSSTPINIRHSGYSTLNDGICDEWRDENMINNQLSNDVDLIGYTYLERFMNQ